MKRLSRAIRFDAGFTIVELVIALVIVAVLTGLVIVTLLGMQQTDDIDRAAQQVYDDLIFMRSRAITVNANHRANFLGTTRWRLEVFNSTTSAWDAVSETRNMPSNVSMTAASLANAGTNLNATPRGLYSFLNGALGVPFLTIMALGTSKTKSINVYVGGALDIKSP
jgi:prepilin-type N-terminal cleavage/methylation domain-containing protein